MNISYFITKYNFFHGDRGGQISHAIGIIQGFKENSVNIKFYGPINDYINNNRLDYYGVFTFHFLIYKTFLTHDFTNNYLLIRKNIENLILLTLANFLPLFKRKKILVELNGFTFERYSNNYFGWWIHQFFVLVHKLILRRFGLIYVVSNKLKSDLTQGVIALDLDKVLVIPNGASSKKSVPLIKQTSKTCFVFYGVFQKYNNYEILVASFSLLQKEYKGKCELHIIGFGIEKNYVQKLIKNVEGVFLHDPCSIHELARKPLLSNKCIGLIPLRANVTVKYLSPVKLFDYISLGFPVLISDQFEDDNFIPSFELFAKKYNSDSLQDLYVKMESYVNQSMNEYYNTYTEDKINKFCRNNSWKARMKMIIQKIEP